MAFGPGSEMLSPTSLFSNNSIDTRVTGYYEANPLISSIFQQGMMTPLSVRTMALLFSEHPRELVLLAAVDALGLRSATRRIVLKNDPSDNALNGQPNDAACRALETGHPLADGTRITTILGKDCNFSAFVFIVEQSLAAGLATEWIKPVKSDHAASSKDDSAAKEANSVNTDYEAQLCFDPMRAGTSAARGAGRELCGDSHGGKPALKLTLDAETYALQYSMRSPLGIYAFLGRLVREGLADRIRLQAPELAAVRQQPFVAIDGAAEGCTAVVQVSGGLLCGPAARGETTLMLIGMLEELRNLSIAPSDLAPGLNSN